MRTFLSIIALAAVSMLGACGSGSDLNGAHINPYDAQTASTKRSPVLYVADYGLGKIVLFGGNNYEKSIGTITRGINGPLDTAHDHDGNLYVANSAGVNVTEYAMGTNSPTFTYDTGMVEPIFVAADRQKHMYEVDSGNPGGVGNNDGFVNEYAQGSDAIVRTCTENNMPMGIAIDTAGDVFLALNTHSGSEVLEYKSGLAGCQATTLVGGLGFLTGIALDNLANLLVAAYERNEVYVFSPPYSHISRKLNPGGITEPYYVSLNPENSYAYVTDHYNNALYVIDYKRHKIVHEINQYHGGVTVPAGSAETL
jgi:DNA-binding beta-propeller fold protein YncE